MTTIPEIAGEFVSDAVTFVGTAANLTIPGAALGGGAVSRWLHRRTEEARDILFDEVRRANLTEAEASSEDDAVGVVYRYLSVAREGAARLNLRLLAKAIVGQLQSGSLVADEFRQHVDALASLSRDEIIVIGTVYRQTLEITARPGEDPTQLASRIWVSSTQALLKSGMDEPHLFASASRAQRSGLIYIGGGGIDGAETYRASPALIALGKTIDFQDALRRENLR